MAESQQQAADAHRHRDASFAVGMILALPRSPQISIKARDAVRGFADELGARRTADACLLVSELVSNAYRHGEGEIRLTIALHDHVARFTVHDDGDATPHPASDPDEHGGWGLKIVARLADRWGIDAGPTLVWFELDAPDQTRLRAVGDARIPAERVATGDPSI